MVFVVPTRRTEGPIYVARVRKLLSAQPSTRTPPTLSVARVAMVRRSLVYDLLSPPFSGSGRSGRHGEASRMTKVLASSPFFFLPRTTAHILNVSKVSLP